MVPTRKQVVRGVLACIVLCCAVSCQTSVKGAKNEETYTLTRSYNSWQVLVNGTVKEVHRAVLAGLKDMDIRPEVTNVDSLSALVKGSLADETSFCVKLTKKAPRVTLLSIRAGNTGDKTIATQMFLSFEPHF